MNSPIISSVLHNHLSEVEHALQNGESVNTKDGKGRNLLLLATLGNFLEMARWLVRYGADMNKDGITALRHVEAKNFTGIHN